MHHKETVQILFLPSKCQLNCPMDNCTGIAILTAVFITYILITVFYPRN